jgi:hypothetical protein
MPLIDPDTTGPASAASIVWRPGWPIALGAILGPLAHGSHDPTVRISPGAVWRATLGPHGPATVCYRLCGQDVQVSAWGPGAQLELELAPTVLGAGDDPSGFAWDAHPLMAAARRRHGLGWRAPRTCRTWEALAPAILEQRVTGREAKAAWSRLVRRFGSPAPGPGPQLDLWVCPPPGRSRPVWISAATAWATTAKRR